MVFFTGTLTQSMQLNPLKLDIFLPVEAPLCIFDVYMNHLSKIRIIPLIFKTSLIAKRRTKQPVYRNECQAAKHLESGPTAASVTADLIQ